MRSSLVVLALVLSAIVVPVTVAADVVVRTCNGPSMCQEVARVPAPVTCHVDYVKGGLGKPGTVRSDCVST